MQKTIIDMHSHVGKDIFHGDSTLDGYLKYASDNSVTAGLIMAVPSPCTDLSDPQSRYMYWKLNNNKMTYIGSDNPFQQVNYDLYNQLQNYNDSSPFLFFVPVLHPIMDNEKYFEELCEFTNPAAIKVHGVGSGLGPKDIPQNIIELIKKLKLPMIVHTDCDNGLGSISMQYVRNMNTGLEWSKFFLKNDIKGILNHGASLDKKVFDLVNSSDLLRIAIGPDLVAYKDDNRLFTSCNNQQKRYYQILRDFVDPTKLLFDIDYNWNRTSSCDDDYEIINRVVEVWKNDARQVLGENAMEFIPNISKTLTKKRILERRD